MSETHKIVTDVTYAELVALIAASELEPGLYYRITDFATKHYIMDDGDVLLDGESNPIINTGATEPLMVLALDVDKISHEAKSENYPQDIIHYDWNPDNWKYDLAFGAWDEEVLSEWKGVIYFRHDTLNDISTGYDWRNVVFRKYRQDHTYYAWNSATTYSRGQKALVPGVGFYASNIDNNINNAPLLNSSSYWVKLVSFTDTELTSNYDDDDPVYGDVKTFHSDSLDPDTHIAKAVHNVHIESVRDTGDDYIYYGTRLSNNVFFLGDTIGGEQFVGIRLAAGSYANIFIGEGREIKLLSNSYGNIIESTKDLYTQGSMYYCYLHRCSNIKAGEYFTSNQLSNTKDCTFGNRVSSCTFNGTEYNTIGNNCGSLHFQSTSASSNILGNLVSNCIFGGISAHNILGNYISYVYLNGARYNFIKSNIVGTFSVPIDLTANAHINATYNTEVFRASDNTIKLSYIKEDTSNYALEIVDYNA